VYGTAPQQGVTTKPLPVPLALLLEDDAEALLDEELLDELDDELLLDDDDELLALPEPLDPAAGQQYAIA